MTRPDFDAIKFQLSGMVPAFDNQAECTLLQIANELFDHCRELEAENQRLHGIVDGAFRDGFREGQKQHDADLEQAALANEAKHDHPR